MPAQHSTIQAAVDVAPVSTDYNYSGIQFGPGVGGRIAGNTISGFAYVGTAAQFPISFGILASDSPGFSNILALQIEGNTLRNNQMHIALAKAGGSVIRNNRFQGTGLGIAPLGLAVSGTNITIANNQFEDMPEGIRLFGNEPFPDSVPGLGDLLGFAIEAQVTSNRFCNDHPHPSPDACHGHRDRHDAGLLLHQHPDHRASRPHVLAG